MGVGPIGFSVEQQNLMWSMRRGGESIREMERTLGETMPRIRAIPAPIRWYRAGPSASPG
jgi:hypothetical protein